MDTGRLKCGKRHRQRNPSNGFKVGNPLPIWNEATSSTQEARKALPKVWLLTGTYYLQSKVHKWKGRDGDTTCKLCQQAPEDETHFLLECESTQHVRQPYLDDLKNTLGQYQHEIFNDKKLLTLCVLNSIHPEIPQNVSKYLRTIHYQNTLPETGYRPPHGLLRA